MIESLTKRAAPNTSAERDTHKIGHRRAPKSGVRYDPAAGGPKPRVPELDGLRGLACLVILIYHMMPHRVPGGWAAVDLFFILSGFLITSIILESLHERRFLAHFIIRRGLRIWPVYYLTVLFVALAAPILPRPTDFAALPAVLAFTQNISLYWSSETPRFSFYLDHMWSLAIEEQFYLIWPVLICLVGRRGVIHLSLATILLSVSSRAIGFHWWLLLARADGLALGSLLAAILANRAGEMQRTARLRTGFATVSLAALLYLIALSVMCGIPPIEMPAWPGLSVLAVNLLDFGIVGLVVSMQGHSALRALRRPWLVKIGKISYGLYMYHYVLFLLSDDIAESLGLGGRPLWRLALTVLAIFTVAALSWRYLEQPLLTLKQRFSYRPESWSHTEGPHQEPCHAAHDAPPVKTVTF